jgi:hypothetical protein
MCSVEKEMAALSVRALLARVNVCAAMYVCMCSTQKEAAELSVRALLAYKLSSFFCHLLKMQEKCCLDKRSRKFVKV